MLKKGMSKSDVENELRNKGEFVQIGELNDFLKHVHPLDVTKFATLKLAGIYEKRSMFSDAARTYKNAAVHSTAFTEKMKHHVKECEMYIKAENFDMADDAMMGAMNQASAVEKNEIYVAIKDFYKRQGERYEKDLRRAKAVKIYEKLLNMVTTDTEKKEIKQKLISLYEKLGRLNEYFSLKRGGKVERDQKS